MVKNIIILGDPLYKSEEVFVNYGFMHALKEHGYNVCCINTNNKNTITECGDTNNMYIINTHNQELNNIIPVNQSNYYVLIKYINTEFLKMRNKIDIL